MAESGSSEALIAGGLLALLGGFGCRAWLIGQMSNVHHESAAEAYLDRNSIHLTERTDTYLYTNVERRPKPKK